MYLLHLIIPFHLLMFQLKNKHHMVLVEQLHKCLIKRQDMFKRMVKQLENLFIQI